MEPSICEALGSILGMANKQANSKEKLASALGLSKLGKKESGKKVGV